MKRLLTQWTTKIKEWLSSTRDVCDQAYRKLAPQAREAAKNGKENILFLNKRASHTIRKVFSQCEDSIGQKISQYHLTEKLGRINLFKLKEGPDVSNVLGLTSLIMLAFFGFFLIWFFFARIDSAATAGGKIIVSTYRKTIQHKEGGIIRSINVKEGQYVKHGDILIELEGVEERARYNLLNDKVNDFLITQARLIAEKNNLPAVIIPKELADYKSDPHLNQQVEEQLQIFNSNKKFYDDQINILNQRILQLRTEITGMEAQVKSDTRQLELVKEEENMVLDLEKKHIVQKSRILSLGREIARLEGDRGDKLASISRSEQKIGETKLQLIMTQDDKEKTAVEDLDKTQNALAEASDQLKVAKDKLERLLIRSPEDGKVLDLKYHTKGGVIQAGSYIMSIVPHNDQLVIEAMLNPADIDIVKPGLEAIVQVTPFKQRRLMQIKGVVTEVSADAITPKESQQEGRNNQSFFLIRVEIPKHELAKFMDQELYPGMPVQVSVKTGTRTPFDYFITPITTSLNKAFRED